MNRRRFFLGLWFIWVFVPPAYAQHYGEVPPRGDAAAAEQYVQWAQKALDEGRRKEAREVLERAADFADVSSDLSYLLALARFRDGAPKGAVLEALRRGLEADRWYAYSAGAARLLEAETLIVLRSFSEALRVLGDIPPGADEICLRLSAFKGLGDREGFCRTMALALEQYPWDPRPVRLLFAFFRPGPSGGNYAPGPYPGETGRSLINTALKRLPLLVEADGELAYLAAPFIAGLDEGRRYVAAYRARGDPNPASLPAALELGLIDENQAMDELFSPGSLLSSQTPGTLQVDRALLFSLWALLRTPESRDRFSRNLSAFSGVIRDDGDEDGYPEARTLFSGGLPESYYYDPDQDGAAELVVSFNQGVPEQGVLATFRKPQIPAGGRDFPYPVTEDERPRVVVRWEQYPAVGAAFLEGVTYVPRPFEFFYSPVRFVDLLGSSLRYPEGDPRAVRITRRTLGAFSLYVERPGRNFDKARERVTLDRGIPQGAVEFLGDQVVSETEFALGRPLIQRVDLDLDGRMETVRRFREGPSPPGEYGFPDYPLDIASSQSDWDGDGVFEMGEEYFPDGTLKTSWNLNRDGVR